MLSCAFALAVIRVIEEPRSKEQTRLPMHAWECHLPILEQTAAQIIFVAHCHCVGLREESARHYKSPRPPRSASTSSTVTGLPFIHGASEIAMMEDDRDGRWA